MLVRNGHTEAAVDLAVLCDSPPAGVICEIMNESGEMARVPELIEMAKKHGLKMITIADLVRYRYEKEHLITREASIQLPSEFGDFRLNGYSNLLDDKEHLALYTGDLSRSLLLITTYSLHPSDIFRKVPSL